MLVARLALLACVSEATTPNRPPPYFIVSSMPLRLLTTPEPDRLVASCVALSMPLLVLYDTDPSRCACGARSRAALHGRSALTDRAFESRIAGRRHLIRASPLACARSTSSMLCRPCG